MKGRAPAQKGILGLRMWLARHGTVPVPLLRAPSPRWQAAPKDWIPGALPEYLAEAVIKGRVAKTTKEETVYHKGHALKVSTAMKETMEAERWAPELRVCCQPPDAMPSDTRLHRLLVALLGVQVQVNAPCTPDSRKTTSMCPWNTSKTQGACAHHRGYQGRRRRPIGSGHEHRPPPWSW